jgi:glucan phosphoethanolaminetransferase (alkaline phosphatase superfamily)
MEDMLAKFFVLFWNLPAASENNTNKHSRESFSTYFCLAYSFVVFYFILFLFPYIIRFLISRLIIILVIRKQVLSFPS